MLLFKYLYVSFKECCLYSYKRKIKDITLWTKKKEIFKTKIKVSFVVLDRTLHELEYSNKYGTSI